MSNYDEYQRLLERVKEEKEFALQNYRNFSFFVADMECFPDQYSDIFSTEKSIKQFRTLWSEMEILNALMLSEWEEAHRPADFSQVWNAKYYQTADTLSEKLMNLLCEEFALLMRE